jgi:colanic acid/amylovoran biosynthesis glycosyltransferase
VSPSDHHVTYVCKVYPRFSETFIVSELLGREAAGERIDIVSLRPPSDGRFHEQLARVRAPVTYLEHRGIRDGDLWSSLRDLAATAPVAALLDELLAVEPREAHQALVLAEHVRTTGTTHLHAHFGSVATTVARLASLLTGVTYSFTAHAKDIFHESVDPADLRRKLADAHHVVTVSEHNVTFLRGRYGDAAATVRRVYNGIELDAFTYRDPGPDRSARVIAVGRLVEKKGFDVLLDAVALLRDRGRVVATDIVGSGQVEGDLRTQAERLGLTGPGGPVRFAGPQPQWRVRELVADAAVMAAPCVVGADGNADGLPTTILESLALGTPVVSTDVTGIPEAVRDEVTGLQVDQRDPVALAHALERLLDDHELRVRLARAGRQLVEREFSSSAQVTQLRALLPPLPVPTASQLAEVG